MPDYPATGKRMLQDNGSWLACLRKDNVELVRTGIERIVADGVVTVDGTLPSRRRHLLRHRVPPQRLPLADGRSPAATARSLRDAVGRRADGVPRHHGARTSRTSSACTGRARTSPTARSLIFQSECQVDYVMEALRELLTSGHRTIEPRPEVHDEYAERYRARSRSWCGRTRR